MNRTSRLSRGPLAVAALLVALASGACGDPPGDGTDAGLELPEACGEASSLEIVVDGAAVADFEATDSVARREDDQTWIVGIADFTLDAGSLGDLSSLPAAPGEGTRVVMRLHSDDGPIASGNTFTAADLGLAVSVASAGVETPVTSLNAQAQVAYVDETTICGSISVDDPATAADPQITTVGGSFAAST